MAISLLEAIRNGDQDSAKRILQQRLYTSIDKQTSRKDGTALFWACCRGYIELVHLLILHGADVNKCTSWGASPLHASADHNHVDVLRLLLRFGANINLQTAQGDTACHLASYRGYGQCVQCLAEHGADINITNSKQHTVVEDALNRGHYEIYQYLLAVQEIINKCKHRASSPHPVPDNHKQMAPLPPLPSTNPTAVTCSTPVTFSNYCDKTEVTLDNGRYFNKIDNTVGVLRLQQSSLFTDNDSLLSSDSLSTYSSSNDLSRKGSFYSRQEMSFKNIP